MEDLLTRFDLRQRFSVTLTAEDVTYGKPHPEIYLKACALLKVAAANVLVLEDSETGTRSAAGAGAFTVSVPNQHTRAGDFSTASLIASSLDDSQVRAVLLQGLK